MADVTKKAAPSEGAETFYQRFTRLIETSGLSDTDIGSIMGLSAANVGRIKSGQRKSLRFDAGLKLCAKLDLDPWDLAFGRPRPARVAAGAPLQDFEEAVAAVVSAKLTPILGRLRKIDQALSQTETQGIRTPRGGGRAGK